MKLIDIVGVRQRVATRYDELLQDVRGVEARVLHNSCLLNPESFNPVLAMISLLLTPFPTQ